MSFTPKKRLPYEGPADALLICEPSREWFAAFSATLRDEPTASRLQLQHANELPSAVGLIASGRPQAVAFDADAFSPEQVLPWLRGLEGARAVRLLAVSQKGGSCGQDQNARRRLAKYSHSESTSDFDYHAVLREEGVAMVMASPRDARQAVATVRKLLAAVTDWSDAPLPQQIWQRLPWG